MKLFKFSLVLLFISMNTYSQVGINTTTPDESSMLDIHATNKGLLIPRVALLNHTDVSTIPNPATGLMVYKSGPSALIEDGFYYWDGSTWATLAKGGTGMVHENISSFEYIFPNGSSVNKKFGTTLEIPIPAAFQLQPDNFNATLLATFAPDIHDNVSIAWVKLKSDNNSVIRIKLYDAFGNDSHSLSGKYIYITIHEF